MTGDNDLAGPVTVKNVIWNAKYHIYLNEDKEKKSLMNHLINNVIKVK